MDEIFWVTVVGWLLFAGLILFWLVDSVRMHRATTKTKQDKCDHPVLVDGAGPFYNDLVCESCGHRINWEARLQLGRKLEAGKRIRQIEEGEMFHSDGVYKKGNIDAVQSRES